MAKFQEQIREWRQGHPTTTHICTCPVCGSPAQHETTPHGETYITCGHCARITFDATAGEGESEYTALAYTGAAQAPDAMREAVSLVHAMRHVPERSPHYARERAAAGETAACPGHDCECEFCRDVRLLDKAVARMKAPSTPIAPPPCPSCDDKGGCPECDPAQEALAEEEVIRIGALAMLESGITACTNCGGRHHPQRCPEIGAALVNWSSAPLSPVEALRLAVTHCVGAVPTMLKLRAALDAADEEALIRAEQLAAAREHAGQTWETWQEERAQGSPF